MSRIARLSVLGLFVLTCGAHAEVTPPRGAQDPRVRIVDYDPANVIRLTTYYGVSTHIAFADSESIRDVALGDDQAWKVVPRTNHLFLKPLAKQADTNLTVVTNRRIYQFALVVLPRPHAEASAWADPDLVFSLAFRYPQDEQAQRSAEAAQATSQEQRHALQTRLAEAANHGINYDYWVAGDAAVSPTAAHDDGRFIYLTFNRNRDMPAVFAVDADDQEALINSHVIEGHTIVIQRMVKHLMLRKGNAVASVVNQSFDLNGGFDNGSGTIASDVARIIRGAP